jgi:uncharacterized protein YciI
LIGRRHVSIVDHSSEDRRETKYYLIFLNSIPGRLPSPEAVNLHAAHLAELDKAGKLVLAGPVLERAGGLIVLRTSSLAEARAIADEDPLVRGGYQTYELGTWLMSNDLNNYRPNLQPESHK